MRVLAALCLTTVACGRAGFGDGEPLVLERIQRGSVTLDVNTAAINVPIEDVDPARAVLLFGAAVDSVDPSSGLVMGHLEPSQLSFQRGSTLVPATVTWQVVEFASGVTVQRGEAAGGDGIATVTRSIEPVDITRSFALASWLSSLGQAYDNNDFVAVRLAASDSLELRSGFTEGAVPPALPTLIAWQVISIDDAHVQSGATTFDATAASAVATVDAVDPAHTLLFFTWWMNSDVAAIGRNFLRGRLTDPTRITFDRGAVGEPVTAEWFLVSLDAVQVRAESITAPANVTMLDIPVGTIDPARTVTFLPASQRCGSTPLAGFVPEDRAGVAWFTAEPVGNSTLRLVRGSGADAADAVWSIVQF